MKQELNVVFVGGKGFEPYETLYKQRIPEFERSRNVKVNIRRLLSHPDLNSFTDKLSEYDHVDVISSHTSFLRSYGQLYSDLSSSLSNLYNDLLEPLKGSCTIDGRMVAAPRFIDVRALHYRTDIIGNTPPDSWDKFIDIAIRTNTPPIIYGWATVGKGHAIVGTYMEILHSFGGSIVDEKSGDFSFLSSEGIEALKWLVDAYRVNKVTPPETPELFYQDVSSYFMQARAVMVFDWPGWDSLHNDPRQSKVAGKFGIARYPLGKRRSVYGGSHSFSLVKWSKKVELGEDLIDFLTSAESQILESEKQGSLPSRKSAWSVLERNARNNSDEFQKTRLSVYKETVERDYLPIHIAPWRAFSEIMWPKLNGALRGTGSPESQLKAAFEESKAKLGKGF